MAERTVVVGSKVGLHARPAATFTRAAGAAGVPVTIAVGAGDPVDAASMLAVMTLGVEYGTEVTLRAEGEGADRVLDSLVGVLASDLDAA
ncbi:HPr family phosphocarrier protein [Nocardia cyriacigeorgica]|nr:HPr family phosphocarrier protein [Nocardia cyriacigeorgica]